MRLDGLGLVYVGNGAFIPGVPARDLTAAEVAYYGGKEKLIGTELYAEPRRENKVAGPEEQK
jgi:hypothetical protein